MHMVLSVREWSAVIAVVVGVGLLGSSSGAQGAADVGFDFHLALIAALAVIAVAGVAAARLPSQYRTPALGAIAGLGYGVLAICARILPGFTPGILIRSPAAYTLAAAGIISFMLYASALESGSVTVVTAAVILLETVPPALIGVLFLGDTTKPGLAGLAIAGFMLALVSAIALARFGEAGVRKDTDERTSTEARRRAAALRNGDRRGRRQAVQDGRSAQLDGVELTGSVPAGSVGPSGPNGSGVDGAPIGSVGPSGPNGVASQVGSCPSASRPGGSTG